MLSTGVTILLQNSARFDYLLVPESRLAVRCFEWRNKPYHVDVTCPSGAELRVTCPAKQKREVEVQCPARYTQPECTTWDGFDYAANPDCTVQSFTPHNTTCVCTGDTARRLATGVSDKEAVEFATRFAVLGTEIGTTFANAPDLTDVENNLVIVSTLAVVVGAYILGLILFRLWDHLDQTVERRALEADVLAGKKQVRTVYGFFNAMFPDELRAAPWYVVYWSQLLIEHPWVAVFARYDNFQETRSFKWTVAIGRLVIFLFVNCIVAEAMYPDDGYCRQFEQQDTCEAAESSGGFFKSCEWVEANESCRFLPPPINLLTNALLTLIVSMLSVPFEAFLDYCLHNVTSYFHHRRIERKATPKGVTPPLPPLRAKRDEFATVQTRRSTLMRAARLQKAQQCMDLVTSWEEAGLVVSEGEAELQRLTSQKVFFREAVQQIASQRRYYAQHTTQRETIRKRLDTVRNEADTICLEVAALQTQEERELFLVRSFFVSLFSGHEREIVGRYFMRQYRFKRTAFTELQEMFCLVALPVFIAVMIYYIFLFNVSIGSRATDVWLTVTMIVFMQDMLLHFPIKIWMRWIVFNNSVGKVVRELCERLIGRSRLVLMRTSGVVRHATALVQHFNPACRVARMYPQYPISRLLMSLNDSDLPPQRNPNVYVAPYFFFTLGLLLIAYLPELLQDSVLTSITTMLIDLTAVGVYFLGRYITPVLSATLMLLCFCGYVLFEYLRYRQQWATRDARERSRKAAEAASFEDDVFYSVDDEAALPETVKNESWRKGSTSARFSEKVNGERNDLLKPLQGLSERWLNKDSVADIAKQRSLGGVPMELIDADSDASDSSSGSEDGGGRNGDSDSESHDEAFEKVEPSGRSNFEAETKSDKLPVDKLYRSPSRGHGGHGGYACAYGYDNDPALDASIASVRSAKPSSSRSTPKAGAAAHSPRFGPGSGLGSGQVTGSLVTPSVRLREDNRIHPGLESDAASLHASDDSISGRSLGSATAWSFERPLGSPYPSSLPALLRDASAGDYGPHSLPADVDSAVDGSTFSADEETGWHPSSDRGVQFAPDSAFAHSESAPIVSRTARSKSSRNSRNSRGSSRGSKHRPWLQQQTTSSSYRPEGYDQHAGNMPILSVGSVGSVGSWDGSDCDDGSLASVSGQYSNLFPSTAMLLSTNTAASPAVGPSYGSVASPVASPVLRPVTSGSPSPSLAASRREQLQGKGRGSGSPAPISSPSSRSVYRLNSGEQSPLSAGSHLNRPFTTISAVPPSHGEVEASEFPPFDHAPGSGQLYAAPADAWLQRPTQSERVQRPTQSQSLWPAQNVDQVSASKSPPRSTSARFSGPRRWQLPDRQQQGSGAAASARGGWDVSTSHPIRHALGSGPLRQQHLPQHKPVQAMGHLPYLQQPYAQQYHTELYPAGPATYYQQQPFGAPSALAGVDQPLVTPLQLQEQLRRIMQIGHPSSASSNRGGYSDRTAATAGSGTQGWALPQPQQRQGQAQVLGLGQERHIGSGGVSFASGCGGSSCEVGGAVDRESSTHYTPQGGVATNFPMYQH